MTLEEYYRDGSGVLYAGDSLTVLKELPSESVDCIISSPPYFGLRNYQTATWEGGIKDCDHIANPNATKKMGNPEFNENRPSREATKTAGYYKDVCPKCGAIRIDKQIGIEKMPEEFVAKLVEVFHEAKRVLKDSGNLWLNLGDSYAGSWGNSGNRPELDGKMGSQRERKTGYVSHNGYDNYRERTPTSYKLDGIKPKDLIGIPWAVAFALRNDGWYLRQEIIWEKLNPLPESVNDRCSRSHEHVFLLAKNRKYFFDNEAIKEPIAESSRARQKRGTSGVHKNVNGAPGQTPHSMNKPREYDKERIVSETRNKRSVWSTATSPSRSNHYASFPSNLISPMILAGTSEKGCCSQCGKPVVRMVETQNNWEERKARGEPIRHGTSGVSSFDVSVGGFESSSKTIGWEPTCDCGKPFVPCVVLDPFVGSGTTAAVAKYLGRRYIGIDLKEEYLDISKNRLKQETLFT